MEELRMPINPAELIPPSLSPLMAFVEGILAPWPWSEGPGGQCRVSPVPSGKLGWASSSSLQVAAGLSLVPSGCSTSALSSRLRASSRACAAVRFRRSEG